MMRILLVSILFLTLLFAVCITLIHAQPYDDSELRAFLTPPEGCPVPCFMNIFANGYLNATTVDESIVTLESHDWVGELDVTNVPNSQKWYGTISWTWSGLQPSLIDDRMPGILYLEDSSFTGIATATNIGLEIRLSLGDIFMVLGKPDESWFGFDPNGSYPPIHMAVYEHLGIQLWNQVDCPLNITNLASKPLHVSNGYYLDTIMRHQNGSVFPNYDITFLNSFSAC